jgi:TonB family protein
LHSALGYSSQESSLDQSSFFNRAPRPSVAVKEVHERTIDGAKAECVEIIASEKLTREVCVDQTTGTLLREKRLFLDGGLTPIGSKLFPRSMALIEDGRSVAEVQITEFKTGEELPASLFDPLAGAISRAGCMNPVPGRLVHRVDPQYPVEDRFSHISGTVAIYAVIDKAGIPQGLQIVSTVHPSLDKPSLEAIRKWRYEPDTCGGNPVDTETVIEVHFVLSQIRP